MNIILLGYRGCGKTTMGKMIADQLWKTFVDTDQEVCKRFNNPSIAEIWAQHGEKEWRQVESEVTVEVCARKDLVIALGGGVLTQPEAHEAVENTKNAVRIYLYCQPQELHRRIQADAQTATTRPALTPHGGSLDEIEQVLAERDPVYRAVADTVFDVTHVRPDNGVRHLVDKCL